MRDAAAPEKRIDHHDRPPEHASVRDTELLCCPEAGMAKPAEDVDEQKEVNRAQRQVRKEKRLDGFHFTSLLKWRTFDL